MPWIVAIVAAGSVVLSSLPRIWLAAGALPDALRPFVWSDLYVSYEQLLAGGQVPYWETVFYYPPGIGYIAGGFSRMAPDAATYLSLWTALLASAAGLAGWSLARAGDAWRALVYWSLSPQLLLHGGANFDILPTAAVVGAILLARHGRRLSALALLGLGTVLKAFPAAVAPLELDRMRPDGRRLAVGATVFGGVVLILALPSLLAPFPSTLSLPQYAQRVNFDSPWGLVFEVAAATGREEVVLVLGATTIVGLIATYFLGVLPHARRARDPVVGAGLAVITVLLWSRLFSPQYTLWTLPFFVLLGIRSKLFLGLALADTLVFLTVYPLTLVRWAPNDLLALALLGGLAAAVALRHVVLVALWLAVARSAQEPARPGPAPRLVA